MAKASYQDIITGLDIGSTSVRIVVGQRMHDGDRETLQIIGAAEAPSTGVNKGVISSIEDAISSVSSALEMVERMTGVQVESAYVGISGSHVASQESKGVVAVSRSDGEIREEDVERALDGARNVATPINYEILHVLPKSFTVDGQSGIKDPVGMTGIRLEVDAHIIQGFSTQIKNLTKCVYRTGIEIDDIVLGILANAEAVATLRQRELGVAVVNIGGSTTSMAVYEEGDVLSTVILPIGSDHVTSDIAIGLKTSIDVAERVKVEYGVASSKGVKKEPIDLSELGAEEDEVADRKFVSEIIEARVEEIFGKLDAELKRVGCSGRLPAGIILTGGGSKLSGLVQMAKDELRLPATLGYPVSISSITDRTNDIAFSTAVGLVQWGQQIAIRGQAGESGLAGKFAGANLGGRVKKLLKSLLP